MRTEIRLWSVEERNLIELKRGSFAEAHKEKDLEEWVEQNPDLLGRNLTIIGRQVQIPGVGIIDLLALDDDGQLVIIEFKREQTTRDTIAQILDYASSISQMSAEQLRSLVRVDAGKIRDGDPFDPAMIVVAADADQAVERIVKYLADKTKLPLEVVTFTYATMSNGKEIIGRSILTPEGSIGPRNTERAARLTIPEMLRVAEGRGVLDSFRTLHEMEAQGWYPEMFDLNGGQIRFWVKLSSGSWRVLFGMYVGSEKYDSPRGDLDVWVRPEVASEFSGLKLEEVQNELRTFKLHRETQFNAVLRIGRPEDASQLRELFLQWTTLNAQLGKDALGLT